MIKRKDIIRQIDRAFKIGRIVSLLGPRQCGKTTIAREFVESGSSNYFDLEDPIDNAKLFQPMSALKGLKGLVVIDEVQRQPGIFPVLRVLADRRPLPARFLILGSSSPVLIKHSSESLAGRMIRLIIGGFSLSELGQKSFERHWLRGGLPRSFLERSDEKSFNWRKDYIQSFVERDLPQCGIALPPITLIRYWTMLAHYHGQIFNTSEIARSLGISEITVSRYLDVLGGVFMVRRLQPWHANIKKRQVKAPKIYFYDSGILHGLLGIHKTSDLMLSPKLGASWEGYIIEEAIRSISPDEAFFWATHTGAEIDLVFIKNGKMYGIECKRQDAPGMTPSIRVALQDLKLEHVAVIYPGNQRYKVDKKVTVVPFDAISGGMKSIFG